MAMQSYPGMDTMPPDSAIAASRLRTIWACRTEYNRPKE